MKRTRNAGETCAAHNAVGIGVGEGVKIDAEKRAIVGVDLTVKPQESKPAAIVAVKDSRRQRRCDGRSLSFSIPLASQRKVRPPRDQRAGKCGRGLAKHIAGEVVAAGGVGGGKSRERCFARRGPPQLDQLATIVAAARASDEIDYRACRAAVFRSKRVRQHGHLVDGRERDVGEDRLPPPHVNAVGAIHLEPGLPAARAIGGDEELVHEDVALVDGRAVGRVQQRQPGDAAREQRRLLHLPFAEMNAELRLIGAQVSRRAFHGHAGGLACNLQMEFDVGATAACEFEVCGLRGGEAVSVNDDCIGSCDGQAGKREAACGIAPRGADQVARLAAHSHARRSYRCSRWIHYPSFERSRVRRLRNQAGRAEKRKRIHYNVDPGHNPPAVRESVLRS